MSFDEIGAVLERRGWTRAIAGDYDFGATVKAIQNARESGRGMLISGAYGCGKTSLVNAILCGKPHLICVRLGLPNAEYLLECGYGEGDMANPMKCSVILDDLGAEKQVNEYGIVKDAVGDFIVKWHTYAKWRVDAANVWDRQRLFITTNLSSTGVDDRYGGRVLSRLKDLCVPLRLNGNDKRKW